MVETKADAVSCAFSPKFTKKGEGCLTTMGDTMAVGVLKKAGGDVVCAHCELADTPLKRLRGLLGRTELAEDEGMLFRPAGSIHMFFMRFPIDALFCSRELVVLGIERDLQPWRTAKRKGAKVVVELPVGGADGLEVGDRLFLETATMEG
jgi:uncharacterized membrane protein (UPF0127 family)